MLSAGHPKTIIGTCKGTLSPALFPLWALLLLVPVPSLGGAAGMWWWPDAMPGKVLYALSKIWLVAFPLLWHRFVDGGVWRISLCSRSALFAGVGSGLLFFTTIWGAGLLAADRWVDVAAVKEQLAQAGFADPGFFLLMGLYWCTVNAVLEEMAWRWFVLRQLQALIPKHRSAALPAAAAFTLHHLVVVSAWLGPLPTLGVNLAIFAAGGMWCRLTLRHQSVLPACISHILADIALVSLGLHLFF